MKSMVFCSGIILAQSVWFGKPHFAMYLKKKLSSTGPEKLFAESTSSAEMSISYKTCPSFPRLADSVTVRVNSCIGVTLPIAKARTRA